MDKKILPVELIGSIPRTSEVINAIVNKNADKEIKKAVEETIKELEGRGCPVISDGEQGKPSFLTYPIAGSPLIKESGGASIFFEDGHVRSLPVLVKGPFKYQKYAVDYLNLAKTFTTKPVKQAVISASALSLIYPQEEIKGYSRVQFEEDLVNEVYKDIDQCLKAGAHCVQVDATELRLSLKLDPSLTLLSSFIELNNRVFDKFNSEDRAKIGVHICPGADQDSTHSLDVEYNQLLSKVFQLHVGRLYLSLKSEKNPESFASDLSQYLEDNKKVFLGVIDVNNPKIETPQEVCDLIIKISSHIPIEKLGFSPDCGFSPFCDDISTSREVAFAKISSMVEGVRMARTILGL
eukprot:gene5748-7150_t